MYKPKISNIKVSGVSNYVIIPITSDSKPELNQVLINKWQKLIDTVARIVKVPSGLIMKIDEKEIGVFLKSNTEGNPYEINEKAPLLSGLYCETVMGTNDKLLIPNALDDDDWKNNPDVKLNMISYLGFPIRWPDNEVFGTICVLDSKTNAYSELFEDFIAQVKQMLEQDLKLLQQKEFIERSLSNKELLLNEINHRLKNNLNSILSYLRIKSQDIKEDEIGELLISLSARVQSLVSIQEIVLANNSDREVDLKNYIPDVSSKILELHPEMNINLNTEIISVILNIDEAIIISQILLELINNSIKYAFKEVENKSIEIRIIEIDENTLELKYFDNGPGLTNENINSEEKSLGMRIVYALTDQLDGSLEYISGKNDQLRFVLKKKVYEDL